MSCHLCSTNGLFLQELLSHGGQVTNILIHLAAAICRHLLWHLLDTSFLVVVVVLGSCIGGISVDAGIGIALLSTLAVAIMLMYISRVEARGRDTALPAWLLELHLLWLRLSLLFSVVFGSVSFVLSVGFGSGVEHGVSRASVNGCLDETHCW